MIGAGYYGAQVAVTMYHARATITFEPSNQPLVPTDERLIRTALTDYRILNTQPAILRSRILVGRLVDELSLIDDPEFNGLLQDLSLLDRMRMAVSGWEPARPPVEELHDTVVDAVVSHLSINSPRLSAIFRIEIETTDPANSALIVNRLAELYIENQILRKLGDATRAMDFLSLRTAEFRVSVETLEQDLARQIDASGLVDTDLLQAQNLQLRDLRGRISTAEASLSVDQALQEAIAQADGGEAVMATLEASNDRRFAQVLQRFRAGQLSDEGLARELEEIADDLEDNIRSNLAQRGTLQTSADALSARTRVQSGDLIRIQQLERELASAELLYDTFFARLQETSVRQGQENADARILSLAVPLDAGTPRISMMVALAAVLGIFLAAAVVLVREARFAVFRATDDVRETLGTHVFGTLPSMAVSDRLGVLKTLRETTNSVFSEAVRNLRTSILMANPDKEDPQVILVTSSIPGEGKTTLSLALARYFSSLEGRSVLLVEAGIRRQALREYVDETRVKNVQLMDVVLGKATLDSVDLMDPDLGVDVLMGSGGEVNAADLFQARRFKDLITDLRRRYDHIIIDSPPVLAVPDARVLAQYADLSVFAVRWNSTSRTQAKQGLEMLASVGHPANGIVLTQVDDRKMDGYGYGGRYGYDDTTAGYFAKE